MSDRAPSGSGGARLRLPDTVRVIIRRLDVAPSRPEPYTISSTTNDPINGYLHLGSSLGKALAQTSPGDEAAYLDKGKECAFLFVSLETAATEAA